MELVLSGGRVWLPGGPAELDVGVQGGRIAAIAGRGQLSGPRLELGGLDLLPGVIDSQVHFREPGLTHKEDLATGSAAAALGGVTAFCEMPNTRPSTTTAADLQQKLDLARGRAWVDHAFFVGASAENAARLGELELLPGCAGVKIFMGSSTGSLLVADDQTLAEVLGHGRRRVAVHCEDEPRLLERRSLATGHPRTHPLWRDEQSALRATERLLRAARRCNRPVHVLHVTTAEEMELLGHHKDLATVEVTPQHLWLQAPDCYEQLGSLAQMNPPIREARHQSALWQGILDGTVDVLGSDHAPHSREEKARPYPESPSGMPGVQTLLPLMLEAVSEGRLGMARLIDLTSAGPARIYGMRGKGRIARGMDADFTVVDLKRSGELRHADMASRCGWTPFDGWKVRGWPVGTVLRGEVVMWEGQLQGAPQGRPLRFEGCAEAPPPG